MKKRNKVLLLIPIIFSLSVFCSMTLLFMGCYLFDPNYQAAMEEEVERKELEQATKEQVALEEERIEAEQPVPAEDTEVTEKEVPFPNEPVIYTGNLSGIPVTLNVNFKTKEVTGSMPSVAKGFPDTIVTDGTVYLDTLEIYVFFTGVSEMDSDGNVIDTSWLTMTGKVSSDLVEINVEILNEEGDSGELTLTR
jgi:hypothetical protein